MGIECALFGQHRFAFDDACRAVLLNNPGDDGVVLGRIASPMNLGSQSRGIGLELFEVFVEARHRVELDLRRQFTKCLPLGHPVGRPIAFGAGKPHRRVVPPHPIAIRR